VERQRNPGRSVSIDAAAPGCAFRSTRATRLAGQAQALEHFRF
jgi:hypothetical protein